MSVIYALVLWSIDGSYQARIKGTAQQDTADTKATEPRKIALQSLT